LQVLQVELFHYTKGTTCFWILACCWQPFPAQTLNPPVPRFPHLITIAEIYCNLVNATKVKNVKWFGDRTRIDARDADGMAQLNSEAHFFK